MAIKIDDAVKATFRVELFCCAFYRRVDGIHDCAHVWEKLIAGSFFFFRIYLTLVVYLISLRHSRLDVFIKKKLKWNFSFTNIWQLIHLQTYLEN